MVVKKASDVKPKDCQMLAIYGGPKAGKSSFAASSAKYGKTLLLDFENGAEYLSERGFHEGNGYDLEIVELSDWFTVDDVKQLKEIAPDYDNIVVDPMGEAMQLLIGGDQIRGQKNRQKDGSLTMAGWGEVKQRVRNLIKFLRGTGKNIILVFHDDRYKDGDQMYHSLMLATGLKEEIPGMVKTISYLAVVKKSDDTVHRVLYTPAAGGNYDSGDRTSRVPETVEISEMDGWGDFIRSLAPLKKDEKSEQKKTQKKTKKKDSEPDRGSEQKIGQEEEDPEIDPSEEARILDEVLGVPDPDTDQTYEENPDDDDFPPGWDND